ncbi:hypothetical protein ABPG74_022502 [Tetrahymena malaccensis]
MSDLDQTQLEQLKNELRKVKDDVDNIFKEIQVKNKQKFEDFNKFENDTSDQGKLKRKNIFLSLNSYVTEFKANSQKLEKCYKVYDNYILTLEGELEKMKQGQALAQNNNVDQPFKKDPSKEKFDNPEQQQQQKQDQQSKTLPPIEQNYGGQNANAEYNQNEKDLIIQQLKMELEMKDRDLILAAEQKQQNQELYSNYIYLEKANQELKYQLSQKMDNQRGNQEDFQRLKEEADRLKRENQFFIEQYEALKQKSEQQEGLLEYIVAENSRLIIQSFAVSDKKYKI